MASDGPQNPWPVLGISPTPDRERIRSAYLAQARIHHPDHYGLDSERFRQQEERMRIINLAYRAALNQQGLPGPNEPSAADRWGSSRSGSLCLEHGVTGQGRCRRCQRSICSQCPGFSATLCNRHLATAFRQHVQWRLLADWIPMLAWVVGCRLFLVPLGSALLGLTVYAFILGVIRMRRTGWTSLLHFWVFPFGLIVSGMYALYEDMDHLNRASRDENLWRSFARRL